jgi:hypothetical protein
VREQTALDLQTGLKPAHECQYAVAIPHPIVRLLVITAEAEVVIAPDPDRTGFLEEVYPWGT